MDFGSVEGFLLDEEHVDVVFVASSFMLKRHLAPIASLCVYPAAASMTTTTAATASTEVASAKRPRDELSSDLDVPVGTKARIPLWAARSLYTEGVIEFLPHHLASLDALMAFKAEPTMPSIASRSPRMYDVCAVSSSFLRTAGDAHAQRDAMIGLYQRRHGDIIRTAMNSTELSGVREKLARRENGLLTSVQRDALDKATSSAY